MMYFVVSSRRCCRSSELVHFSFFSISGWGTDLDCCDIEWFALEMNWDHSVVFEIAPKYCISDSSADCEGYSISSKGFLPTVVDIKVIWIKFSHSCPFCVMCLVVRLWPTRLFCPWEFSKQEYWSGSPCPPPGDLPNPGIKSRSPRLQVDSLLTEPQGHPQTTRVGSLSFFQGVFPTQE